MGTTTADRRKLLSARNHGDVSAGVRRHGGRSVLVGVAVVGACLAASSAAGAQEAFDGEFSVQRFNPAPGPRNGITSRGARQAGNMSWSLGAIANYGYKPFVIRSCISETDCDDPNASNPDDVLVVENLVSADILGSLTVIPDLQLGLRLPITWVDGQGLTDEGVADPDELSAVGLGDAEFEAKYRFVGGPTDTVALAGGVFATAPLGSLTAADSYIGSSLPKFGVRGIFDVQVENLTIVANLIGMFRDPGRVGTTEIKSEFGYVVGARYAVAPPLEVVFDAFGSTQFSAQGGTNALETLLGARLMPGGGALGLLGGVGTGVLQGVGVPAFRAFLGATWVAEPTDSDGDGILDSKDSCPALAEDRDGFQDGDGCPEGDNDEDGIGDAEDKCPDQAEDLDDFEDTDGCPELDNDKDGIPDLADVCRNEPETKNGYRDEDGCPDEKDTDEDGVPDARDKCPTEAEDTDGYEDTDGCPDLDNDGDGIPDNQDECIDQPEDIDEDQDEDGCPDLEEGEEGYTPPPAAPAGRPAPGGAGESGGGGVMDLD